MKIIIAFFCIILLCGCTCSPDLQASQNVDSVLTAEQDKFFIASNDNFTEKQNDAMTGYHVKDGILYYFESPVDPECEQLSLKDVELSDYSVLNQFVRLKALFLDGSTVADISFLQYMPQLEDLSLLRCKNITDFSYIRFCPQLNRLVLSGCTLERLPDMSTLSKLEVLLLNDTANLSTIDGIGVLHSLKGIDLSFSELHDISNISSLENLEYLNLWRCRNIKDFSPISGLHNITTLDLSQTSFNDLNLLASMGRLESLYLTETAIQDYTPLLDNNFPMLADLQCDTSDAIDAIHKKYGDILHTPEVVE